MNHETLTKLHSIHLDIGKEIKRICDLHGIDYILDSGTLLGAVRHQGFIPWDDDMDFAMTRDNYERFLNAANADLDKKYFLQTWETDKNYPMPYAKIRLNNTRYIENVFEKADIHQGIYVDILPYDIWPKSRLKQRKLWLKKLYIQALIMMKCHYMKFKSNKIYKYILKAVMFTFIKFISVFYSKKQLIKKYKKLIDKYNREKSNEVYEQTVNYKFAYWVIPKICLENYTYLNFENTSFQCPENYDVYLKSVYGDYMKLPPVEERNRGHQIIEIDFGKYFDEKEKI